MYVDLGVIMLEFGFECECFGPETCCVQSNFTPHCTSLSPVYQWVVTNG